MPLIVPYALSHHGRPSIRLAHFMIRSLFALALLAPLSMAQAASRADQDPWYDVELIVFEYKGPPGDGSELWPDDPGNPDLADAVEPVSPVDATSAGPSAAGRRAPAPIPFQLLDSASFKLKALETRLGRSTYRPLIHVAWRQPVGTSSSSVHVHGGPEGSDVINGTVKVGRSRFLQAGIDLLFHQGTVAVHETATPGVFSRNTRQADTFRLQQARRIRAGEITYFDHPRFGAIMLVTPFNAPARREAAEGGAEGGGNTTD
jgi:hypothetical protein